MHLQPAELTVSTVRCKSTGISIKDGSGRNKLHLGDVLMKKVNELLKDF